MSKPFVSLLLAVVGLAVVALAADPAPGAGLTNADVLVPARPALTPTVDVPAITTTLEQQVRDEVQEFVRAFNAHDAKAIAAEWSPYGTYTDQAGTVYKGRDAIEKLYAAFFVEHPEAQVAVEVEDVQLVKAFTAIEHGTTQVTLQPGAAPTSERYVATHVRQGAAWVMVSVEDLPDITVEQITELKDLAWLVGTWRASAGEFSTEMSITRIGDGPFFQRAWTARVDTNVLVQGLQVIGWDAALRQVASWTFDSRGNTDKGLWSPEANGWSIACNGTLAIGTPFRATYLMTRCDDDTLTVNSMNRFAGDVALPDMPELSLKRVAR